MIETKQKDIDGHSIMVTQLPARRALRLQGKLLKIFGAALTAFMLIDKSEKKDDKLLAQLDREKIEQIRKDEVIKMVSLLASSVSEEIFDMLTNEILQGVRMDGHELKAEMIDQHFSGKLTSLYQVIWYVLEVNFGDFFESGGIGNPLSELNPQDASMKKTYTFR